ncbi:MAG: cytochrome c-type biogenesis protein CcmH [Methylotenera sp.]|nr:cytochrome c-type biogenesis protein CcmH [Methylotenera sp.]MDP1755698.1 cytochrome c-type biogenesis protein CcmH [Methylotenera sp.]MDP1960091.1 cytochrome c-type biogenesis protein CcmH [Methylotenera sp.]MDP3207432.1 cytochrome c-type biogenesis protein CcmH [Methylotenera sp.]MDP3303272.1 cytochrome c-type biogenesis protein CcmH [Methylotenera sp.]
MKLSILKVLSALLLILPLLACAEARPLADDPAVEARLRHLSHELRCLVCQNQTLADSNAPLAQDLRQEVRALIVKGLSDQEITDYLVVRYGDFVRYRPAVNAQTLLLWIGPALLLAIGFGSLWWTLRRRNSLLADIDNNDQEEKEEEA